MPYILDGIIVIIVLICVFLSAKKGFVFTLIEAVGFVAVIVITFMLSSPISNFVYDKAIEPSVITSIENTQKDAETAIVDTVWNKMPQFITQNNFFNISKDNIVLGKSESNLAQELSDTLIKPVSTKILSIVISAILFFVLIVAVKFLAKYINELIDFSVMGDVNKVLGGILGLVKGVTFSLLICLAVSLILSFTENGFLIFKYDIINSTYIFKYLMEFLPI